VGTTDRKILFKHILPNVMVPITVQTSLGMGTAILFAAGLGFLGIGVQPPTPEWGAMLGSGRNYLFNAPHVATFPGLAIFMAVLGFNLLGDGLRDALDPRFKL
jgi:ABC-type dipeptide/oligopeptide/nickel transport system permease subunit